MNEKGSTLIECIISINIIMLCVLFLFEMFFISNKYMQSAKDKSNASDIAQEYIENIKNNDMINVLMYDNKSFDENGYLVKTKLNEIYDEKNANLMNIEVVVMKKNKQIAKFEAIKALI